MYSDPQFAIGYGMHTEKMVNWLGNDTSDRLQRLTEAVELMRKLWRGDEFERKRVPGAGSLDLSRYLGDDA